MMVGMSGIMASMGPLAAVTSYANAGGTGNRTSIITVAHSDTSMIAGGSPTNLVNGALDNSYYWQFGSGGWLRFDFGTAKVIDEFKWYQDVVRTHGTWKFQGSADASAFIDISPDFTLGPGTFSLTNTTAYRYYRLIEVSGGRTNVPYLREIEFKIA